jgi:integrase
MANTKKAGQIIPRGPKKWLVRVFVGRDGAGKRKYVSKLVHGGKKAADDKLAAMLGDRSKGVLTVRPKETVDQYLDAWLDTTAKPSVRARTLSDYTNTLKRYVRPHLGHAKLAALSPVEVREMLVALRDKGLAPRTVRMAHEVLRNALEQAVADRLIPDNPARSRLVKKALPQKERREPTTIPADKVAGFLEVATADRLHALWTLLLMSGLRPSEALALRWADVNGNAVSVVRVLVDKAGVPLDFAPPKSQKSRRAVVVPEVVAHGLADHRKRQVAERLRAGAVWEDGDLVFCDEVGRPMRQDHVRHHFGKLCKAAKLPDTLTPYALRHSCATLLLEKGVPLKVVSERLGHSTISLTADVYSHVTPSMQKQAADVLGELAQ